MNLLSQTIINLPFLVAGLGMVPAEGVADDAGVLPVPVTIKSFAELKEHSPFVRSLNVNKSLILTGMARIEAQTVATLFDVETRRSYTLVQGEVTEEGWQLVEIDGDPADVESLTAKVKVDGVEVVSIRYEKTPIVRGGTLGAVVSTKIGNGTPGGGLEPHGGPDPRVLTPDQLKDARNGARNIKGGFKADGYGDNNDIPPEVLSKVSKLSLPQREKINVKMYEYRNRGLGMQERQKIYNGLLDKELKNR